MFSRHQAHETPAPEYFTFTDPAIPSRACCCPARPVVKVMMPPAPGRPRPVDLWLCGHHYHASFLALQMAGAVVEELDRPSGEPQASHASSIA